MTRLLDVVRPEVQAFVRKAAGEKVAIDTIVTQLREKFKVHVSRNAVYGWLNQQPETTDAPAEATSE